MNQSRKSPISIAGRDAILSLSRLCSEVRTTDDWGGTYQVSARCLGGELSFTEESYGYQVRISASGIGVPRIHSGVVFTTTRVSYLDLLIGGEWAVSFRLLLGRASLDADQVLRRNLVSGGCVVYGQDDRLLRQLSDESLRAINQFLEQQKRNAVRANIFLQDHSCAFWVTGLAPNASMPSIASAIDTFAQMKLWTMGRTKRDASLY